MHGQGFSNYKWRNIWQCWKLKTQDERSQEKRRGLLLTATCLISNHSHLWWQQVMIHWITSTENNHYKIFNQFFATWNHYSCNDYLIVGVTKIRRICLWHGSENVLNWMGTRHDTATSMVIGCKCMDTE